MAKENLPAGLSLEEVKSLLGPKRSYGTCDTDIEMSGTDNEEIHEPVTPDPKATTSASEATSKGEGQKSERAKTRPTEESRKRNYQPREEEPRKRKRRSSKRRRSSPSPKRKPEKPTESSNTKKGIHCTEIFLTKLRF